MSRYKPLLTKDQIKFIIDNPKMDNTELAERFEVGNNIIAQYKHRLRKIGVDIPSTKREGLLAKVVNDQKNE